MTTLILNFSFYFYGEWYGILVETTLRFVGWFGTTSIFTMLILPIHKYKRPLHHLLCSLNSLFGVLNFSVQRSFTCLVIFIPTWFFKLLWMELSSWFLSQLLRLCRGKTHFCMLVLHPDTLLKVFINFKISGAVFRAYVQNHSICKQW